MSHSKRLLSVAGCEIDSAYTLETLKEIWESHIDEWSRIFNADELQELVDYKNRLKDEFMFPDKYWGVEESRMRIGTNALLAEMDESFQRSLKSK